MKNLITSFFLFACVASQAQTKMNVYFLKNDGSYVTVRDSANFIRIVTEPDSGTVLYNVAEYYLDNKKKSLGKSSAIDPPHYEGQYRSFYKTGARQQVCFYKDGSRIDDEFDFYPNGKPYLVLKYPSVTTIYDDENYLINACYDSTGVALAIDGNGQYKIYDDDFKRIVESGAVKNGKKDGECRGAENGGKWKFVEKYDNGTLLSGEMKDDTGKVTTYTKSRSTPPSYKGGLNAFYQYLSNKIIYPDYEIDNKIGGTVVMDFVVEKNGKISDIEILHKVSPAIDREAIRVVSHSPLWVPGTRFGRPVRVRYALPLNFSVPN